jgi:deazaflavin-dependent oxidoreductase (nitroreductase family)
MTAVTGSHDTTDHSLEADLAAWGRVILLETKGRLSGRPRRVAVGFIEDPDGALLVAAADEAAHWARNLLADPRCRVEREGIVRDGTAAPLDRDEANVVAGQLILKYGTPAERQGGGPAFRLSLGHPARPAAAVDE